MDEVQRAQKVKSNGRKESLMEEDTENKIESIADVTDKDLWRSEKPWKLLHAYTKHLKKESESFADWFHSIERYIEAKLTETTHPKKGVAKCLEQEGTKQRRP